MGYERNDRGYGRDGSRFAADRPTDRYDRTDPQDRGFFERAGDEVRSWFGDEEAERRRRYDERFDERYDRDNGRYDGRSDAAGRYAPYQSGGYSNTDYPRYDRSNQADADRGYYARDRYASRYPESGTGLDRTRTDGGYRTGGDRDWRDSEYRSLYGNSGRTDRQDDPHGYHSWRDQQISSFDRDYDEYRRENHSRFASEFSAWRENRQSQRTSLRQAKEHQEVVGSDGAHVGTVDHVRGDRILLTKTDKDAGGHHHSIPSAWIQTVDDKVHISKTAEQAHQAWRDEENNQGLFGGRDDDRAPDRGAANLNRSFSGTY
jgi:hypothetical protein